MHGEKNNNKINEEAMKALLQYRLMLILLLAFIVNLSAQDFVGIKQINGAGIFCRVLGKGEPLIVVHGGPGLSHNYLLKPFSQLAKNYKLIFYDQRGNGLSDEFKENDKFTIDSLVEELEGVRKEFGVDNIYLAGQSWGAIIAINYIAKYPQHVKKLLLLEPAPGSSDYLPDFRKRIMRKLSEAEKEELQKLSTNPSFKTDPVLYKKYRTIWFSAYYYDHQKQDTTNLDYIDSNWLRKFHASSAMFTPYLVTFNIYEKMKSITCPLLIIHGYDDVIPNESIEKMKSIVPNAELHIIKNCGHFVHVEKEKEYFELIREFLAK